MSTPISHIESLSVSPQRVANLFKATANLKIGQTYTKEELFEGEDGVLFARVEIVSDSKGCSRARSSRHELTEAFLHHDLQPGFPHKVYVSTSLADPAVAPATPPS